MIKKILAVVVFSLNILISAQVQADSLTCDRYYTQWFFGVLTALDTPSPYIINNLSISKPNSASAFSGYIPTNQWLHGLAASTCTVNPDGTLTLKVDNGDEQPPQMMLVAIMYPSEPSVWNVVLSNLPGMENHNFTGKLRPLDPTLD